MPPSKQEIIEAHNRIAGRLEALTSGLSEQDLAKSVYPGWTVKDLLCHLASTSAGAAFFIGMAQAGQQGMGPDFDIDSWNAEQVLARRSKSVGDLVAEFRAGYEASIKAVEAASDELLAKQVPNFEGGISSLAELAIVFPTGHTADHLNDIDRALRL